MDNQYTFTPADMQRLTAIIHINDERRVPEQVMNLLEGFLRKPEQPTYTQIPSHIKPNVRIRVTNGPYAVGETLAIDEVDKRDTEGLPIYAGGYWFSLDSFEIVEEGGTGA